MANVRVTVWDKPNHTVSGSQWGDLHYEEWCSKVCDELRQAGIDASVVENLRGEVAVFRRIDGRLR